jgi:hypothetical protein
VGASGRRPARQNRSRLGRWPPLFGGFRSEGFCARWLEGLRGGFHITVQAFSYGGNMTRVEHRKGFDILLEEPPSHKSLWAAMVRASDTTRIDLGAQLCLACTREAAMSDARAFIDSVSQSDLRERAGSVPATK